MADYYPLISRAIAGLKEDSHETRRAVYQKARMALDHQLRAVRPALSEADIARERLALDEAIGKIEAERTRTADMLSLAWMSADTDLPPVAPSANASSVNASVETIRPDTALSQAVNVPQEHAPTAALSDKSHNTPQSAHQKTHQSALATLQTESVSAHAQNDFQSASGNPPSLVSPASLAESGLENLISRERPRMSTLEPSLVNDHQRKRRMILGGALGCTIALIAGVAIYFRDKPAVLPQIEQPVSRPLEADAKIVERLTDRTGSSNTENTKTAQTNAAPQNAPQREQIAIAQKAFLYEPNTADPSKENIAFIGRAIWRVDMVSAGDGQPLETALRGDIDVPDAGLTLTLLLRKNADLTLPASHILQMTFGKTANTVDNQRIVKDAGVPQFKQDEAALRGTPLAGLPVPIADGVFLVGLSNVPSDVTRNLDLLATKMWFDIPIRYANGRKAVLAVEKGLPGERAVSEVLKAWKAAQ